MARRSRSRMSRKTKRRSRKRSRRSRSRTRRRSRRRSRRQRGGNSEPEIPKIEMMGGEDSGADAADAQVADTSDAGSPGEEPSESQDGGRRRRKKKGKKKSGKKRKMNAFMVAKEKARKGGAENFQYKGKTYKKKKLKTGMVVYSSK